MKHLPNLITVVRLGLLPWFGLALVGGERTGALVLLGVMAFSDVLDGWLARRFRLVTRLGSVLDPLADKLLQITALVLLVANPSGEFTPIPAWFVGLVFTRDLLLVYGALRIRQRHRKVEIRPRVWGRLSTALVFCMVFGSIVGLGDSFVLACVGIAAPVIVIAAVLYTLDGRRQFAR